MQEHFRHIRSAQTLQAIVAIAVIHTFQTACNEQSRLLAELVDFGATVETVRNVEDRPADLRALVPSAPDYGFILTRELRDVWPVAVRVTAPLLQVQSLLPFPDELSSLEDQWSELVSQTWRYRGPDNLLPSLDDVRLWLVSWQRCLRLLENQMIQSDVRGSDRSDLRTPEITLTNEHVSVSLDKMTIRTVVRAAVTHRNPSSLRCRYPADRSSFGSTRETDWRGIFMETKSFVSREVPVVSREVAFPEDGINRYPLIQRHFPALRYLTVQDATDLINGRSRDILNEHRLSLLGMQAGAYNASVVWLVALFVLQLYVLLNVVAAVQNQPGQAGISEDVRSMWTPLLYGGAAAALGFCTSIVIPTVAVFGAVLTVAPNALGWNAIATITMVVIGVAIVLYVDELRASGSTR